LEKKSSQSSKKSFLERQKQQRFLWFTAVLRRKYSVIVLTYDFAHGLS